MCNNNDRPTERTNGEKAIPQEGASRPSPCEDSQRQTVDSLLIRCPAGCGGPYVVQPGDTLFSIAQTFSTSVQAILNCNPQITDPDRIFPGQVFCVPGAPAPTQPCPADCGGLYIIQPGDTLFAIANRFNTTVNTIVACNPQIVDPDLIFAGTFICVPQGEPAEVSPCPPGCGDTYVIRSGDTLSRIAQRFGTSVQAILNCNPQIRDPNVIFAGQIICVPGGPGDPCPSGCGNPYLIQQGDSLFTIAQRFGTSVQAILNCNPQIRNPNLIFPGQVICVPGAPGSSQSQDSGG